MTEHEQRWVRCIGVAAGAVLAVAAAIAGLWIEAGCLATFAAYVTMPARPRRRADVGWR